MVASRGNQGVGWVCWGRLAAKPPAQAAPPEYTAVSWDGVPPSNGTEATLGFQKAVVMEKAEVEVRVPFP